MHHISVEAISAFWAWEREHYASSSGAGAGPDRGPILMKDIFNAYFVPRLQGRRADWDNYADERILIDSAKADEHDDKTRDKAVKEEDKKGAEMEAHVSFEHCRRACEESKKCFQFKYKEGVCGFGFSMKLGRPVPGDGMVSGWDVDKIERWTAKRASCEEVLWPKVKE